MKRHQLCFLKNNKAYFYNGDLSDIDVKRWKWDNLNILATSIPPVYLPRGKVISVSFTPPPSSRCPEGISADYINKYNHPWMTVYTKTETKFIFPGITVEEFEEKMEEMGGVIGERQEEWHDVRDFVYSDPHFNHEKIITSTCRPFSDTIIMNYELLMRFNALVTPGDRTYFLGDIGFGELSSTIKAMNGYKILILGNHDKDRSREFWLNTGFNEVVNNPLIIRKSLILSHEPMPMVPSSPYFNIHGHLHNQPSPSKKHLNVCVEKTNYEPLLISKYKWLKKQEK